MSYIRKHSERGVVDFLFENYTNPNVEKEASEKKEIESAIDKHSQSSRALTHEFSPESFTSGKSVTAIRDMSTASPGDNYVSPRYSIFGENDNVVDTKAETIRSREAAEKSRREAEASYREQIIEEASKNNLIGNTRAISKMSETHNDPNSSYIGSVGISIGDNNFDSIGKTAGEKLSDELREKERLGSIKSYDDRGQITTTDIFDRLFDSMMKEKEE